MNISQYIDHTILKADATEDDITRICKEAIEYNFASVCVNPGNLALVSRLLQDTPVKCCCVIGFPLGANTTGTKVFETMDAINKGADEIDMVLNIGALKDGKKEYIEDEIQRIKLECGDRVLKVIIETCYLTDEEKELACNLAVKSGADFVKTSTGFGPGGAILEDVVLMKNTVGDEAKVKASGGVRDYETAKKYIEAGAERLGTSNGVAIAKGEAGNSGY